MPTADEAPGGWLVTDAQRRWSLALVCAATFMLVLDVTIVNVALPPMQAALHAGLSQMEWVVDAYAMTLAAFLLLSGSLADRYGRRRAFLVGMAIFTVGSLGCSLAQSPAMLIGARAVQGLGGATLFATALGILGKTFKGADRSRALGVWGAALAAGLAIGPLAGGLLTDTVDWRAIFWVNIPIGAAALVLGRMRLAESADPEGTPLDWLGGLLFASSLGCVVFSLVEGNNLGWRSIPIITGLLTSAVLVAAFVSVERRRPGLFDLTLFSCPTFDAANLATAAQGFVIGPLLFYLVRYLQQVLGASPLAAGLEVLPLTASCMLAALIGGRLTARVPERMLLSAALLALGSGTLLMSALREGSSWVRLLPGLMVAGVGWGAINPVAAHGVLSDVPDERSGMASGINNTARQVGIATGLGALGALFQQRVQTDVLHRLRPLAVPNAAGLSRLAARAGVPDAVRAAGGGASGEVVQAIRAAMTSALHQVLVVAGVVAIASGLIVTRFRPRPMRAPGEPEPLHRRGQQPPAGRPPAQAPTSNKPKITSTVPDAAHTA